MVRDRKKEVKLRKMLLVIWAVFIIMFATFAIFLYKKKDTVKEDLTFKTKFSYQTNANQDVNALVITYLGALATSNQEILQSCVTNPAQFDDISSVQKQAKIITGYSNVNCYTVDGLTEGSVVCYAVANISIVNIESTPLDMLGPYYIVYRDGNYLIDNTILNEDITNYLDKVNKDQDIQDLYKMVKENEDECAAADPAFKSFLDKISE